MRQGVNGDGELLSSFYVDHEPVDAPVGDGPEDNRTRQEFKDECDINVILATYETTGVVRHINGAEPAYFDVSEMPVDLLSSMRALEMATDAFMMLPAKVRREFDNDPVKFADYAADPANRDQMKEWGLLRPEMAVDAPKEVAEGGEPPAPAAAPPAKP